MSTVSDTTAVPLWQAADLLGLEVEMVFDLLVSGRLEAVRKPNGRPLIPIDQINHLKEQQVARCKG